MIAVKKGLLIETLHGIGPIHNFEIYPPLYAHGQGTRQPWAGPDYLDELPGVLTEGSFIRVGVSGVHPTLDVAYYTLNEVNFNPPK